MKSKYKVEYRFSTISSRYLYYVYKKGSFGVNDILGIFDTIEDVDDFMEKYLEAKKRKYE